MTQKSVSSTNGSFCQDRGNNNDSNGRPLTPPLPEASKLWIHCNNCFEQYAVNKILQTQEQQGLINRGTQAGRTFLLLACQHVTCEKCVTTRVGRTPSDAPIFVCRICRNAVRGRQMNNTLVSNLKVFFHPEPWTLCSDEIHSFQSKNMKHFTKYKANIEAEIIKDEADREFARKICQQQCLTNRLLIVERRKLRQRLYQIKRESQIRREQMERESCLPKSPSRPIQFSTSSSAVLGKGNPFLQAVSEPVPVRRRSITSFPNPANHTFDL